MIVDVHTHYYPDTYLERIDRPGLLARRLGAAE